MDSQKLSLVLNGVLVLVIIVLVAFGVKEGNFGGASKESLQSDYIEIDLYNTRDADARKLQQQMFQKDSQIYSLNEKVKELEAQIGIDGVCQTPEDEQLECSFDDLSEGEKKNFVSKKEFEAMKKELQNLRADTKPSYEPKVQKPADESEPVATMTCSEHLLGSHYIPAVCKEKVIEFLQIHEDASKFNLIGMVDQKDFALIEGLKNSDADILEKLNVNQFHIDQFELIAPLGLARARAKEAMQLIKQKLGKDMDVTQASYELVREDRRGFVLQAFE